MKKFIAFSAVAAMLLSSTTAFAYGWHRSSSSSLDVDVDVDSDAYIKNVVDTTASTGGNTATGGSARNRVSGRSIDDTSATGGYAGDITTGDAMATTYVDNTVNGTLVEVTADCGCRGDADIDVDVDSDATVKNYVDTTAKTGRNSTIGGDASNKVTSSGDRSSRRGHHSSNNSGIDDTTAQGGSTGEIDTGAADSLTDITNIVGGHVVRVTR